MTGPTREYGEVFTKRWVAETILDLAGYTADRDLGAMTIVEPSIGSGAFLIPIAERLLASAKAHGRDVESLSDALIGYDIQAVNVVTCTEALSELDVPAQLASKWLRLQDFLLDEDRPAADFVVGNPPYIRLEDLAPEITAEYRRRWGTMGGRADIYVGFYQRSLSLLRPDGCVAFICADRWMRNQYGARLREFIGHGFAVENVWTMHDVDAFETQVSAYPAITVVRRALQREVVVADAGAPFGAASAADLADWSLTDSGAALSGAGFEAHRLPHWFSPTELWPTGSPARLALIEHLNERFAPLHDGRTGTKVSIGIATGNDKVYVTRDPSDIEPERVLPLSMSADLRSGEFEWGGRFLVNPWESDGRLVDLKDYPKLAHYLGQSADDLHRRHVAQKSPNNWHRTIDRVYPGLVDRPKLLLQDMRASIHPVLESGGFYPHHNLYYVVSDVWDMEVLGGLLLSRIAQAFIEAYCVRMRGGTLRFQAQYLKRIRVPDPASISADVADELRVAFRRRDVDLATAVAAKAYGLEDLTKFDLNPDALAS